MLHGETVTQAVFSADGRRVLSVSAKRSFVWRPSDRSRRSATGRLKENLYRPRSMQRAAWPRCIAMAQFTSGMPTPLPHLR